ncbi:tRNA (adenosine(37)-N6)-threonylcarbamoyltransferase complex transferase subunit TsaD [Candidatus Falkowbacteria bacterium]|jgi:N6-L-threonylcarbamoyladenine synthase|nr:tRNA (adenosine(37)-N6)-threonylcarbamoyltransferase complex transferase subunit TsaD [Candidatus Falkowbacteria bacterium]
MYILGIETSCDETAASVIKADQKTGKIKVLSNIIASQIAIHQKYGGVVPEVAAREHVLNILPVIDEALKTAQINYKKLNLLAVTKGPGLITSLATGVETVRALSFAWQIPVMEINHIEGHLYSNFIKPKTKIKFPAIIMTVSGGHTNLVVMTTGQKIKIIGETLDDAAGEAYDKGAKMMGLGYPGGPIIAKMAEQFTGKSDIILPRPMINSNNFNFSFSGLKTALLYQLQKDKNWKKRIPEYCFAYQEAIIDILIAKTIKAAKKYQAKSILLSGGVSANQELRKNMQKAVKEQLTGVNFLVPEIVYTTDNAAMIATAAAFKIKNKKPTTFNKLKIDPSLQLK